MPTHFLQTRPLFTDIHLREIFANVTSSSHLSPFRGISYTGSTDVNPYTEWNRHPSRYLDDYHNNGRKWTTRLWSVDVNIRPISQTPATLSLATPFQPPWTTPTYPYAFKGEWFVKPFAVFKSKTKCFRVTVKTQQQFTNSSILLWQHVSVLLDHLQANI